MLATGAALTPARPAIATPIATPDADPIYAAIEEHQRPAAKFLEATTGTSALEQKYPKNKGWWEHHHDHPQPPANGPEPADWMAGHIVYRGSYKELEAAGVAFFTTRPTTLTGMVAALEYAMEREFPNEHADPEYGPNWGDTVFGSGLDMVDPVGEAAYGFLFCLADALREISEARTMSEGGTLT